MKKRLIAYHLPQFHEIKENNEWWGEGYTEWTAVKNWKPYFKGHQLRKPSEELGYYDLSNPQVLEKQYEIASNYGLEGFCFWTYWFGNGEMLLEKPLEHLLLPNSKVKYCFAWANHSWWDKSTWRLLKEQKYLGKEDYINFYKTLSPHFNNPNYIKKDNKLVLVIYESQDIPDLNVFMDTFNKLAIEDGYDGFFFIADHFAPEPKYLSKKEIIDIFDSYMCTNYPFKNRSILKKIIGRLIRWYSWTFLGPDSFSYPKLMKNIFKKEYGDKKFIPMIFTGWDSTPRHKKRGIVTRNFNEKTFEEHARYIFEFNNKNDFVFIKSWNEWAEGNVLEPDDIFGTKLLNIIKKLNNK